MTPNPNPPRLPRTTLAGDDLKRARRAIVGYLKNHDHVTNRILRSISDFSYDQCIHIFGKLVASGDLIKIGAGSGTRYALPPKAHRPRK